MSQLLERTKRLIACAMAIPLLAFTLAALSGCQQPAPQSNQPLSGEGVVGNNFEGGRDAGKDGATTDDQGSGSTRMDDYDIDKPDMADATQASATEAWEVLNRALDASYTSVTFDLESESGNTRSQTMTTSLDMYGQLDTSDGTTRMHAIYSFGFGDARIRGLEMFVDGDTAVAVVSGIPVGVSLAGSDYAKAISAVGLLISRDQTTAVMNAALDYSLEHDDDETTLFVTVEPSRLASVNLLDLAALAGISDWDTMIVKYSIGHDNRFEEIDIYFDGGSGDVGEITCEYSLYNTTNVPTAPTPLITLDASELFTTDITKLVQEKK